MPSRTWCNPEDAVLGGGDDDIRMIGLKWFLGKIDGAGVYGEDSRVARQVMMTDLTAAHRQEIATRYLREGRKSGDLKPYSVSAGDQSEQFTTDTQSLTTGDANVATAALGSYTAQYRLLRANSRGIQAEITISNPMTFSSFAHYVPGFKYRSSGERFLQRWVDHDGIVATRILPSEGMMRSHAMTIVFRTEIEF